MPKRIPLGYCQCGCRRKTKIGVKGYPNLYIHGHHGKFVRHTKREYEFDPAIGYGKCHCGCGQKTSIAKKSRCYRGVFKGKPNKYIRGHLAKAAADKRRKELSIRRAGKPFIGEQRYGTELGFVGRQLHTYHACIQCGTPRWVQSVVLKSGINLRCRKCALENQSNRQSGSKSRFWKNGRTIQGGYVCITIPADHKFAAMRSRNGNVREHRLVMAEHLGRCLGRYEIVHHKNGNKQDNRIDNLELTNPKEHLKIHQAHDMETIEGMARSSQLFKKIQIEIRELRKKNEQLRAEISRLKKGTRK